ncbi:DUF3540 domain-containing protein [Polyangium mundeleinium]|uniref:DUF3540 domain-containing protein n=1 Tax=Polyangium mundeleinium TaxID=2995306 RepID=A0ABT5EL64_9BACT|nr:DUF3540 domain-containing protein [Polyangium mundeleinium]MDC0742491.1 DUF3540 domain-containing protein [Polyangium mundeleinium]
MNGNLARKLDELEAYQVMGTVVHAEPGLFIVRTGRGDMRARRATSCLVEPRIDDFVLVAGAPSGAAWVLAVLEREEGAGASLACDGDLEIKVPEGRVRVASKEGIDLVSQKDVSVLADGVRVHAATGSVVMDSLSYLGGLVRSEIGKLRHEGGIVERVVERVSERVKRSFRKVEEVDQVKAERIDYSAKQVMSLRAENAIVTAEELVKMDGEQIHLG